MFVANSCSTRSSLLTLHCQWERLTHYTFIRDLINQNWLSSWSAEFYISEIIMKANFCNHSFEIRSSSHFQFITSKLLKLKIHVLFCKLECKSTSSYLNKYLYVLYCKKCILTVKKCLHLKSEYHSNYMVLYTSIMLVNIENNEQ